MDIFTFVLIYYASLFIVSEICVRSERRTKEEQEQIDEEQKGKR